METGKALQVYDYFIILGYFSIVLGTAYYFSRRMKLTKDFFTAGGNIPWWLSGISFFMASFSALAFVMYAELSYQYGIISILIYQLTVPGLIIGALWIAKRWKRSRTETPIQFLEKRYNLLVRQALAWTGIPLRIVDDALKIFSTAIFLYVGMKLSILSLPISIGIIGFIMIFYSFMGGQWGVMVIDFVQFIILLISVILLLPLTIFKIGGINIFIEHAPTNFFNPLSGPYRMVNIFSIFIILLISVNSTWAWVQKYNCVKDEKDAQKVAWLVAGLSFIGPILFFVPAMLARVLLPELPNPKYCYAELAFTVLPVGLMGVLVAGMFSATLSTMGSEFNVIASIMTTDFYKRILRPRASEKELMKIGRITTVIIGVLVIMVAILISFLQEYSLFDIMMKAFGALLPATALPIVLGITWKKINAHGAITGLLTGAVLGFSLIIINVFLVNHFSSQFESNPELQYWLKQGWDACSIIFNVIITIAAMYIGSIRWKESIGEHQRIETYFKDLATPIEVEGRVKISATKISNFKVIGITSALFGILILLVVLAIIIFSNNIGGTAITASTGLFLVLLGLVLYYLSRKA